MLVGINQESIPSVFIIEKLYNPCKRKTIPRPVAKNTIPFFISKMDMAMKNPKTPEHKACKKVAPQNLKTLIRNTSSKKNTGPRENKIRMFYAAAHPQAAIII